MLTVNKEEQSKQNLNSSNEEIIKRTEVPNTPFVIIETQGKIFGTFGKYKITEDYKYGTPIEQVKLDLQLITWNKIIQIITLIDHMLHEQAFTNDKIIPKSTKIN